MPQRLHAFSIPLVICGKGIQRKKLDCRIEAARKEVAILLPASRYLMFSILEEELIFGKDQIWLSFDLVENYQMSIDFNEGTRKKGNFDWILVKLHQELTMLKESAENSIIRVGELVERMSGLNPSNLENGNNILDHIDGDELLLWNCMNKNRGKLKHIRFTNNDVFIQIPLLQPYHPETGTRTILGDVKFMSNQKAELANVKETKKDGITFSTVPLPTKLNLLRTEDVSDIWVLLYSIMERGVPFEANVKIALHSGTKEPAYAELRSIRNAGELTKEFRKLLP